MTASRKKSKESRRNRRRNNRVLGMPSAIELIEEAMQLLRRVPMIAWGAYLFGMAPFVVGFLFFWTEMASSGLADQALIPGAFMLGALFLWLKMMQVRFGRGLREALYGRAPEAWTAGDWFNCLKRQAIFQSSGLVVLPIASMITIPFAWSFTWYQNLLLDSEAKSGIRSGRSAHCWEMARAWHEENWLLLTILSVVMMLTFLNWLSLAFFGPFLLKALLGVETVLSRSGVNLFNSTVLFACILLTYVSVDPLIKAAYLLRMYYAESRQNGADIKLRIEGLRRKRIGLASKVAIVFLFSFSIFLPQNDVLAESGEDRLSQSVDGIELSADQLDQTVDDVLAQREFIWRFPKEVVNDELEAESPSWLTDLWDKFQEWRDDFEHWIDSLFERDNDKKRPERNWEGILGLGPLLSYLVIGSFVCLLVYLLVRAWKMYQPVSTLEGSVESRVDVIEPDLNDEAILADALPRNEWVELARELIRKGDYRLALRAYFLAQLSAFSAENLIIVRPAKSNREYAVELVRRGHGRETLIELYRHQMYLFESAWYGRKQTGPEEIAAMESYLEKTGVLQ